MLQNVTSEVVFKSCSRPPASCGSASRFNVAWKCLETRPFVCSSILLSKRQYKLLKSGHFAAFLAPPCKLASMVGYPGPPIKLLPCAVSRKINSDIEKRTIKLLYSPLFLLYSPLFLLYCPLFLAAGNRVVSYFPLTGIKDDNKKETSRKNNFD